MLPARARHAITRAATSAAALAAPLAIAAIGASMLAPPWPAAQAGNAANGTPPRPATPAVHRTDLSPAFATAVCAGEVGALPLSAWAAGVHDAQLEGRYLSPEGMLPLSPARLEHAARALAQLRGTGGYGFGTCNDGRGWALALPSPAPLGTETPGHVTVPLAALSGRCASWRADFAPRDSGAPRTVPVAGNRIATAGLGDGVLSITCQPRAPRWRGPVLWYLYPVGHGPASDAPFVDTLTASSAADALGAWVNRVRAQAGLAALGLTDELSAQASLLAADGSLSHDRLQLKRAEAKLTLGQIRLLGEDRVKARSLRDMAWLLWNSPRHRELLLSPEATVAGLAARAAGDEQLVVLVTGVRSVVQTVKAVPAKRKRATGI